MIDLLATTPALVVACALLGLLVGSFLNVVILRLPPRLMHAWREQAREVLEPAPSPGSDATPPPAIDGAAERPPPDLVFTSSHCPRCRHRLAPWENIPLLSFIALRGRCRHCGARISWQYPLVEALTAIAFAACAVAFGWGWPLLAALVLSGMLIAGSGIDLHTQLLPDQITLPLLWIGLLCAVPGWFVTPQQAILGAAFGYLVLWLVYWAFKLATGKEGLGYGDFKLLAALGAFVGYAGIIPILLLSSIVGAVIGTAWLAASGGGRATPIPFGPFLAIAGWIQFVHGDTLFTWYRGLLGV
ncbi:MAG TPA: A24 family peptidase [Candidatus Saccharimonadia bacterium]|nr:A24 family peptidase [Candidatus Saccharimonadia bacterium]